MEAEDARRQVEVQVSLKWCPDSIQCLFPNKFEPVGVEGSSSRHQKLAPIPLGGYLANGNFST